MSPLEFIRFAAGALIGFLLPGLLLARLLDARPRIGAAFLLSLLILFHAVFWVGIFHWPITSATVLVADVAITTIAACAAHSLRFGFALRGPSGIPFRSAASAHGSARDDAPLAIGHWLCLLAAGVIVAATLLRTCLAPLTGADNAFRWDFLARRILVLRTFQFYPPITSADFTQYGYVDGMPPLVSFSYWWLYAATGRYIPALTCVLVTAQYAATVGFVYALARQIAGRRGAALAVGVLAAAPLFHWSVAIGQETGLTALSLSAMTYFLVAESPWHPRSWAISAFLGGASAALGALSREYGWAFLVCGLIVLFWNGKGWKSATVFVLAATAIAAPWYVRNALLTGNPFYSLHLGGLPVNPVLDHFLQLLRSQIGASQWDQKRWADAALYLLGGAGWPLVAGIAGAVLLFRRFGFLALTIAAVFALWLYSIGNTAGGWQYSVRVLAPAWALCSVAAGVALARITHRRAHQICAWTLAASCAWGVFKALIFPYRPEGNSLSMLITAPFRAAQRPNRTFPALVGALPPGSRVLSDNYYAFAALVNSDDHIVPVWSPEVRFVFDNQLPPISIRQLLEARNIHYVLVSNAQPFLKESPLYREDLQNWHVVAATDPPNTVLLRAP